MTMIRREGAHPRSMPYQESDGTSAFNLTISSNEIAFHPDVSEKTGVRGIRPNSSSRLVFETSISRTESIAVDTILLDFVTNDALGGVEQFGRLRTVAAGCF
jgi:hypothetical protein